MRSRAVTDVASVALAAVAALGMLAISASAQEEFPSKPVIFVAPGTIGGGSDTQARLAADAIDRSGIIDEPVAVINRGAGGSQEAYTFTKSKAGDPHYVLTATNQLVTYPMVGEAGYDWREFTPIVNLVFDPTVVVVQADAPYQTLEDLIEAAKAEPGQLTAGGGQIGTQDHMGFLTLSEATGIEARYVPFAGGGEILRNILGGQIDFAVGNPSDFLASVEGGKLRFLVTLDEERSPAPALADVPTLQELGYDATFVVWRGWIGPPDLSDEERDQVIELFRQVSEDENFKENYVLRFGMRPTFLAGDEFEAFIAEREPEYRALLQKAGVIQ